MSNQELLACTSCLRLSLEFFFYTSSFNEHFFRFKTFKIIKNFRERQKYEKQISEVSQELESMRMSVAKLLEENEKLPESERIDKHEFELVNQFIKIYNQNKGRFKDNPKVIPLFHPTFFIRMLKNSNAESLLELRRKKI